jgi:hypothetical protein
MYCMGRFPGSRIVLEVVRQMVILIVMRVPKPHAIEMASFTCSENEILSVES